MSIQMALTAALSGLKASQQQAGLVSQNIANATTPGYVRKELALSAATLGGQGQGVRVGGVQRGVDELLIRDARFEQSRYLALEARASSLSNYTQVLGQPQEERSVASALSRLQQAFQGLHEMPEDAGALAGAVEKAQGVASRIREAAGAAEAVQADARDRIEASVADVNSALYEISRLNQSIMVTKAAGGDASSLADQRDVLLDRVSQEIGIRTFTREAGDVVVMTRNGQMLVESELPDGAQPIGIVGDDLVVGGKVISADPERDMQSGRLKGLIDVANRDMPKVLEQLDALAAGLVTGFQAAEADPAAAGLFTDNGAAFTTQDGLASRLQVNPAVEGNAWRMRSGMQAATPLPAGDKTQIAAFIGVFGASHSFSAPGLPSTSTLEAYAGGLVSGQHGERAVAEADMKTRKIAADTLQAARVNRDGVNVDEEMQKLLLIEQSYGASAQVIQTAGRMIETLLQIGG
jgi:flagellar hook-associated protein 1